MPDASTAVWFVVFWFNPVDAAPEAAIVSGPLTHEVCSRSLVQYKEGNIHPPPGHHFDGDCLTRESVDAELEKHDCQPARVSDEPDGIPTYTYRCIGMDEAPPIKSVSVDVSVADWQQPHGISELAHCAHGMQGDTLRLARRGY